MTQTYVWDRFIRIFHWSLVAAISLSLVTGFLMGADALVWHLVGGLAATALVVARVIWGFAGGTHARFASFLPRPRALLTHLRDGARHLGHNPLGALMVLALLAVVAALAISGAIALGGLFKTGPLVFEPFATGRAAKEWHESLAWGLVALIALHLGGVAFESWRSRENLAAAMVSGRKVARPGDLATRSRAARPAAALTVAGLLLLAGGGLWSGLQSRPISGAPVAIWDDTTRAECSACHMAYHPSLMPAASWRALMTDLRDHFGEDASLSPDMEARITGWLTAHAAETADTLPAHRLGRVAPTAPYTLTRTPFWISTHADIPDAVFARREISSLANCAACHADAATGWFSPFSIAIPKETTQ